MIVTFAVGPGNRHHVDFDIYSTQADAENDRNPWKFANGNVPNIGFPRDSGPNVAVGNQWNSLVVKNDPLRDYMYRVICPATKPL